MRRSLAVFIALVGSVVACGSQPVVGASDSLSSLRSDGKSSGDGETLGRWALAEMIMPGGDAAQAKSARGRLEKEKGETGLYASLGRAVYDEEHGAPKTAADAYVSAIKAARESRDPGAPLVAWFSASRLHDLRGSVADLYAKERTDLDAIVKRPENIGWRALAELVDWSNAEAFDKAEATGTAYDNLVASRVGCARPIRIAGPFGFGSSPDRRRSFPPEKPGPWPTSWPGEAMRGTVPHVLNTEQHRCLAAATEQTGKGVFYTETYFTSKGTRDLIIAVQGSVEVWVDDTPILIRDLRDWGVWQRFGAAVRVGEGRHRIVGRILADASTIRILNSDGTPAGVATDLNAALPYSSVPPTVLPDPNPISAIVAAGKASSPLEAMLASYLAHIEAIDDVAAALFAPYASPSDAAGVALDFGALYARGDAAFPEERRHRDERAMREHAAAKDDGLWYSRAWLALDSAEQKGLVEGVGPLRLLADRFPDEPEMREGLARLYARLGWRSEQLATLRDMSKRFSDDVDALRLFLTVLDDEGPASEADAIATRIEKLDPDAEVSLDRALARHDWKGARAELDRLAKRRPDRKDIAGRIADVLERAGDPSAAMEQLHKAIAKNPDDATTRFRLADLAYSRGDKEALRRALAESLQAGAKVDALKSAIALVEGATNLEPYRIDGRQVIRDFEKWEKGGKHMDGNAARVLDYSAVWVHPDGSSDMLEHEIQRIQSQEAIGKEAEQQPPEGLVLRLRVIKPDGSTLEPEPIAGKQTLTMPHLEVGDYIEIEHVTSEDGDGEKGKHYRGPQWFFREADKGYWRSEFVVLSPKDRPLQIETRGKVPAPEMRDVGTFVERKWRVDESPPAPDEPDSAPPNEFLPSVRIAWGVSLDDTLRRLIDAASDETPSDPRLRAIILDIVKGVPATNPIERAKRVYRWLLDNVQDGQENDGRRVITGKSGTRQSAFIYAMRLLQIPVDLAIAKNKLAMPPLGPMSEVEAYDSLVLRLRAGKKTIWLTVRDKFAPFGTISSELRGQEAIVLVAGAPHDKTDSGGALDGVVFSGRASLRPDGSADLELVQSYTGKLASSMRDVLAKVPEAQLDDFVESRLVGRNFPGARVHSLKVENREALDEPLVLHVSADVRDLARPSGDSLILKSLFAMRLTQLAVLPERQTPLLIGVSSHVDVRFEIVIPASMKMPASLPNGDIHDADRVVSVKDKVNGHAIELVRTIDIPAGRIQPGDAYAKFVQFTQSADEAVERDIRIGGR